MTRITRIYADQSQTGRESIGSFSLGFLSAEIRRIRVIRVLSGAMHHHNAIRNAIKSARSAGVSAWPPSFSVAWSLRSSSSSVAARPSCRKGPRRSGRAASAGSTAYTGCRPAPASRRSCAATCTPARCGSGRSGPCPRTAPGRAPLRRAAPSTAPAAAGGRASPERRRPPSTSSAVGLGPNIVSVYDLVTAAPRSVCQPCHVQGPVRVTPRSVGVSFGLP